MWDLGPSQPTRTNPDNRGIFRTSQIHHVRHAIPIMDAPHVQPSFVWAHDQSGILTANK
jgi:hypothetical protein